MARDNRLAPQYRDQTDGYRDQTDGSFGEDASGSEFLSHESIPPTEANHDREYATPLFLTEQDEKSRSRLLDWTGRWRWNGWNGWNDRVTRSRLIKGGILAVSAAAIAFALVSLEQSYDLIATVKTSLFGAPAEQADATDQDAEQQPASGSPSLSPMPSTVGVRMGSSSGRANPTRDDIALALRTAHPAAGDPGQPLAAPAARTISAEDVAALLKRAKGLLAIGDIMPARLLLQRAADAQDASATLLLAQTYDPLVLGKQDTRTITPDPQVARGWYERAAALGSQNAKQRLTQMQN